MVLCDQLANEKHYLAWTHVNRSSGVDRPSGRFPVQPLYVTYLLTCYIRAPERLDLAAHLNHQEASLLDNIGITTSIMGFLRHSLAPH